MAVFGKKPRRSSLPTKDAPATEKSEGPGFDPSQMEAFMKTNYGSTSSSRTSFSNKSLSFKEKLVKRQMEKMASKMQNVPPGLLPGGGADGENSNPALMIQELQRENSALSSRCSKLEAQNIIAAAQMVDFISIVLGLFVSLVTYYAYGKGLWWLISYEHSSCTVLRISLLLAPYGYNKLFYGVIYRRFMVFAVFVVFITRVKLCRWRVQKYIKSDGQQDQNLSSLRGGGEDGLLGSSQTSHFGDDITEDDIWEASYEVNARFLYSSILRLRGLWTKTAQYMSSRADFVPVSYVRELSKLQDEAPETEWVDVQKMLAKAGILNEFDSVEEKPIASASIGQVHLAKLKGSDEDVVIKVQHPPAMTLLSDDFISLNIMAWIVGILEPEYKFIGILLREWGVESRKELDFNIEVENLETAWASIESMKATTPMMSNHSDEESIPFDIEIPRPLKHLCRSKQVMVMTFSEGKRIDDLDQISKCNVPKEAIMNALAQTTAYMMYVSDIFNGDPHPGNIFIRPGLKSEEKNAAGESVGFTIVLLDWGLAKRLPETKRAGFCQMTYAAATFDFGLMMDAFKTLGLKLKRENVAEDMEGVRFMLRDMAPREKARRRLKAKGKTDRDRSKQKKKGERVPIDSDAYPGEFFFFVRTNELLQGLGSKLGIDMKYLDILKPYAERGLKLLSNHSAPKGPDPLLQEKIADIQLNKKIESCLGRLKTSGCIAGAQVCCIKNNKVLVHSICGNLGSLKSECQVRSDSLFLGFSVTKAITATLILKMVEEGFLELDEPICERIWPEFAPSESPPAELFGAMEDDDEMVLEKWRWKRSITLRNILTHTSGLWFATPSNLTIESLASCEKCIQGFQFDAEKPENTILPVSEPGSECKYHYISFGWLVGGCVIGSYFHRHGIRKTYEEVFQELCGSLLPPEIEKAGFKPCGCGPNDDIAFIDTEFDVTRSMQLRRESEAMGELMDSTNDESETKVSSITKQLLSGIKGREFILDPRIWNSSDAINANVPAAAGRFSAKGLALFYHELGNGNILPQHLLSKATAACETETSLQALQGLIASTGGAKTLFGLGYAVLDLPAAKDGFAFGHAGIGGSIGFHHKSSNTSVAIMFNKVGGNKESATEIIKIISKHLDW